MSDSKQKQVAVAILNWNGERHLETFLPSVITHSKDANIYVIDNHSSDRSIDILRDAYPEVYVIRNNKNYGFAKGYNEGLKNIQEPFLILLNSDVEVTEFWLSPFIEEFKNNPDTAVIQPKILDYNQKDTFEYAGGAGGYIDALGFTFCRGRIFNHLEKDNGQYNDACDIFWASGSCFAVRNEVFKKLNGFDPIYFAHHEEVDFCWQCLNLGYQIKFIPNSTVYHLGGGTLPYESPRKLFLNFRNSLFSLLKNYPKKGLIRVLFLRLLIDSMAAIFFAVQLKPKLAIQLLLAHISFYKNFFTIYKKRKNGKQEIFPSFKGSIIWYFFFEGRKTYSKILRKNHT